MMKFDHERIDGKLFGKSGPIEVALFQVVDVRYVKVSKTRQYQTDVSENFHLTTEMELSYDRA